MTASKENARELLGLDKVNQVDYVGITVASPDAIRSWSKGEVKNPETINYRTFKPEKGGLVLRTHFRPRQGLGMFLRQVQAHQARGVVCDRCGVEVTLAACAASAWATSSWPCPVCHIWFFKCMPSRIGLALDMTARSLERVIYYEDYMVIDPGKTPLKPNQLLTDTEYREARDEYGDELLRRQDGREAVRDALAQVDLASRRRAARADDRDQEQADPQEAGQAHQAAPGLHWHSKSRPEWMILEVLPVIPPDLRPLVPLEGGRFATSDLNDLYRRVINRNNRLQATCCS
jgi:DNA-directed RNA polymerase subunit beta'